MKLYGTYLSPFTARVLLVARAKGHTLTLTAPPGEGDARADYLRKNPTGKFPFLEAGDLYLPESAVIADYLDAIIPGTSLWPHDPAERARAALLSRFAECWVAPGFQGLMRSMLTGQPAAPASWQSYQTGLDLLDRQRQAGDCWLHGDQFGHADAAFIPLIFLAERFDAATGAGTQLLSYPGFASYWAHAQTDHVVAETLQPMRAYAIAAERGDGTIPGFPELLRKAIERRRNAPSQALHSAPNA
jgi:glutathione S-transferase